MKKYFYFSVLCLLSACSAMGDKKSLYEIKMLSGDTLYSRGQPTLEDGFYQFDDVNKQRYVVKENLILYIEPVEVKR